MSRNRNVAQAVVWGVIARIVTTVFPFVIRTILIRQLDMMYVGLSGVFSSVIGMLSIAELGFGNAMISKMYEPIAKNDDKKVCELLVLYRNIYRIIGLMVLVIGFLITPFLKYIIKEELPSEINIYIIYGIYLINTCIGYFSVSYKQSILYASQRTDSINIVLLIVSAVQYTLQAFALLVTKNYYIYLLVLPLCSIVNLTLINIVVMKRYPQYIATGDLCEEEKLEIGKSVKALFISRIGGMIRSSADNIVISIFLGVTMVGKYDNYFVIISALMAFFTIIMNSIVPSVGNLLVEESNERKKEVFVILNHLYGLLASFSSIMFLCLCNPFMEIWVGADNMLGNETIILLALYLYIHKFCDMLAVFQDAAGSWIYTKWVPLIAAIVNLVLNIVLVILIGLPGVIISTIVSVLFIYDLFYAIPIFRVIFLEKDGGIKYYIKQLGYLVVTVIIGTFLFMVTSKLDYSSNILTIMIRFIFISTVGLTILLFAYKWMDTDNKAYLYVKERFKTFINSKCR